MVLRVCTVMCAVLALGAAPASGAPLRLEPPPSLQVGDRAGVVVLLSLPEDAAQPVLLTPASDGDAVEVVQGRLMRGDAADPKAPVLRFRVPVVARRAGTAVFRVRALFYRCEERCVAREAEVSAPLEVRGS